MKATNISILLLTVLLIFSCDDDFMERYPLDSIADQNFWQTESDLKLYANSFYGIYIEGFDNALGVRDPFGFKGSAIPYGDLHSDNALPQDVSTVRMVNGLYVQPSAAGSGGWNWGNVRALNYFLVNYQRGNVAQDIKNIYAGEVYFFKTMEYFNKVRLFGEVPWYSKPLETNSKELYDPRTPRAALMDSLLSTINKAVDLLPQKGKEASGRLNKDLALLLKARVCLYEGTFRKYHKDLNLSGQKFLQEAADASDKLIKSGSYAVWTTGDTQNDYHNLFIQNNYRTNSEVMLWKEYSSGVLGHAFLRYFLWSQGENVVGFSKSFVEEYLCSDGLPISTSKLYMGDDSLQSEFKNRDPRLSQTVSPPGRYALDKTITGSFVARGKGYNGLMPAIRGTGEEYPSPTGYWPVKYWKNDQTEINAFQNGIMPCPVFRFAEALLINAEANAELGTATQAVLDATVNKLRKRAGMPDLVMNNLPADPALDDKYAKFCGYTPSALIREIRRERRVELVMENFRWDDLVRWRAGKLLTTPQATRGIKFKQYQYPGVVINRDIFLDSEGYLAPYKVSLPNGRTFQEPKQYYFPIPIEELVINKNLSQSPGWGN
ncbi:RagB/SusD family nutrient uptake outer membrane protein [Emticicia sp. CRIBPO]|uniref:RagB/SusD family nutrient uptake outer membrane protein n=1 Tax=Emticicia sp. CRIBPO TaxID=2683258 RepID=UPI0014120DD3|nr:RagB/SusD family nutrient uptake outer membrane protein [Emticicia sp. CRIBPO]NBA85533.1 RagB/SusD family nutrient uptake outer membrane protein [Emticicia sp. CRIBPO]